MSDDAKLLADLLTRMQESATPVDESHGDFDARIPAALWREFVDAHADLIGGRLYVNGEADKLLREIAPTLELWDDGLDEQDGEHYERGMELWDDMLQRVRAFISHGGVSGG